MSRPSKLRSARILTAVEAKRAREEGGGGRGGEGGGVGPAADGEEGFGLAVGFLRR